MKKNRMMRLASGLLVAVLATTSMISGTYAKYVTTDSASDTARVAKWGVTVVASGSLFGQHYKKGDMVIVTDENDASVAIETNSEDNLVAPGTANEEGLKFAVSGTPEVSTKIDVTVDTESSYEEIWLAEGRYGVMVDVSAVTTADNYHNTYVRSNSGYEVPTIYDEEAKYFELIDQADVSATNINDGRFHPIDKKYYPVIWYVKDSKGVKSHIRVSDVATALDNHEKLNASYGPNSELATEAGSVDITWAWPFEVTGNAYVDAADTILGNLMAYDATNSNYQVVVIGGTVASPTYTGVNVNEGVATDGTNDIANLKIGFNAKVTVTQVD